jgi:hypothetical protein
VRCNQRRHDRSVRPLASHPGWGSVQRITLVSRSRHFGGRQWFYVCPVTGGLATVLWKPPGAGRFCSRQAWGRQVAYASQFLDRDSRAYYGQSKINSRLCSIGQFDAQDWKFPPKPKGMRWKTGVDPVRPDTRLVEVMQCTPVVSGSPAGNAGVLSYNLPSSGRSAAARCARQGSRSHARSRA